MPTKQLFSDHLNELRLRLLVWVIFFVGASAVCFAKSDFFLTLLTKPLNEPLFYTSPVGGFSFVMQIAVFSGFIISLPILIYQILKFCQPVLSKGVRKIVPKLLIFSLCLLTTSLLIAFYVFIPAAIHFLKGFGEGKIQALITTNEYFSFVLVYLVGLVILFQMPVIILLINYAVRLEVKNLMKWQKIMIIASFIIAAILTPTPDPINQIIMALPIIVLYELSIFLVWMVNKNRTSVDSQTNVKNSIVRQNKKNRWLFVVFVILLLVLLGIYAWRKHESYKKTSVSPANVADQEVLEKNDPSAILINQDNGIEMSTDTDKFVVWDQYLFTSKRGSGDLFSQKLDGQGSPKIIYSFGNSLEITGLYVDEKNDRIFVTTSSNRLFSVLPERDFEVSKINPSSGETWPDIEFLTTYNNNLYILENESGAIWKYTSFDGITYQPKTLYLVEPDLSSKDAEAIASDGSIYLLFNDGKISKFSRGVKAEFAVPLLPASSNGWMSPKVIFANTERENLYVQDQDRIIEINNAGQYQRQFSLEEKQISASFISFEDKMGWILSEDKIYQFSLE